MDFKNVYEDAKRADAYSKLEFPGTYYLAYRDLPELIYEHYKNGKALDFGCGTGRSTRFLKKLGFDSVGIDISEEMICKAKSLDPEGKYILIEDDDFSELGEGKIDVILAAFTFDNIPGEERRIQLLRKLNSLLHPNGIMLLLDSTPELYLNDWSSFITTVFEENKKAASGQIVKTIMIDVDDSRPVEDVLWKDEDYRKCFDNSGFSLIKAHKPLGRPDEPFDWINETKIAPWVIYVIKK
jgi:SAM-dependent methyltransferase